MTGRHLTHGFRYLGYSTQWRTNDLATDAELGCLDAAKLIPAGSHCSVDYLDCPHLTVITRYRGIQTVDAAHEWRI